MKIITVNLPVKDIKTIKGLVGENGLYPSRSELIRVAIRDFLIKELKLVKEFPKFRAEYSTEEIIKDNFEIDSDKDFVRVPIEKMIDGHTIKSYKTYRIINK